MFLRVTTCKDWTEEMYSEIPFRPYDHPDFFDLGKGRFQHIHDRSWKFTIKDSEVSEVPYGAKQMGRCWRRLFER